MTVVSASRPTYVAKEMRTEVLETGLCEPRTLSTSCDQVIFVDQATDASLLPDATLAEVDWLG
jgi:hypothetical protein